MRILLASSEVHPYSKTGGLGDMVGALGKALARAGHHIGIVTPLYQGMRETYPDINRLDWYMDLPFGSGRIQGEVWTRQPEQNLIIYFIHKPEYFDRQGIYQENGWGYADNAERYLFLSKAIVHLARYLPWQPEIVHLHDWQTGLVPALIRHQRDREGWGNPLRTLLTIHNLAYQGYFGRDIFGLTNLPADYFNPDGVEFFGGLNFLKAGICYADLITTVSPRYAREITTEAFGCNLDAILRRRQDRLVGILNGVDYEEWNTISNTNIAQPYSIQQLSGKSTNKTELQRELGLPPKTAVPLFGNISRLVDQKGTDLLLGSLEEMLPSEIQVVLLGRGDGTLEKAIAKLGTRFPSKVAVKIGFDQPLSHRIEAGCDFYLMPSRFEPCGLNQMYSLRYGTIPVVRRTGGLDDSVIDFTDDEKRANGIKFNEYSSRALSRAIRKALAVYQTPKLLNQFRRNAMKADFSWDRTARRYLEVYQQKLS